MGMQGSEPIESALAAPHRDPVWEKMMGASGDDTLPEALSLFAALFAGVRHAPPATREQLKPQL
jgi:hypothetical protein